MLAAIGLDSMRGREGVKSLITEDPAARLENLCILIDNENEEEFERLVRGMNDFLSALPPLTMRG